MSWRTTTISSPRAAVRAMPRFTHRVARIVCFVHREPSAPQDKVEGPQA